MYGLYPKDKGVLMEKREERGSPEKAFDLGVEFRGESVKEEGVPEIP